MPVSMALGHMPRHIASIQGSQRQQLEVCHGRHQPMFHATGTEQADQRFAVFSAAAAPALSSRDGQAPASRQGA